MYMCICLWVSVILYPSLCLSVSLSLCLCLCLCLTLIVQQAVIQDINTTSYPNIVRWFDHMQHHVVNTEERSFEYVNFSRNASGLFASLFAPAAAADAGKGKGKGKGQSDDTKSNGGKQGKKDKKKKDKKPKADTKQGGAAGGYNDVIRAEFRVGKILSAKQHPDADRLYVEEIDVGEDKPRQVVSGLKAVMPVDQVTGLVVVLLNTKPGVLEGVESRGRVMVGTVGDKKELLRPPTEAKIGELIKFSGVESNPDKQMNSKKANKLLKGLNVNEQGIAHFKDVAFTTSAGVCQLPTLRGAGTLG
jgi:tRNA-binding EMAP/Myf-like protein